MMWQSFSPTVDRWIALRTSARWEKKLAQNLVDLGISTFLPVLTKITHYPSKKQTTQIPLFSGYVFCSESDYCQHPAIPLGIRKQIVQLLKPTDSAQLKTELEQLAQLTQNHQLIQERMHGQPGEVVRIVGGPFSGWEGIIQEGKPNKKLLILEISFLGVRLEVEMDQTWIERIPSRTPISDRKREDDG